MERKLTLGVASMGLALMMGSGTAGAAVALEPQGIQYGSFAFVPTLKTAVGFDDNLYNFSNAEVGSFYLGVAPSFALLAQDRNNVYQLTYGLDGRTYANKSDDSYLDQALGANAHIEPNARLRMNGGVAYKMLHDGRGTGNSAGYSKTQIMGGVVGGVKQSGMGEVDKYDVVSFDSNLEYGAQDARGMLVAALGYAQKRYDRMLVANGRDNDQLIMSAGLRMAVMPKTKATFDIEHIDTKYSGLTPDTVDDALYVGLAWKDTAQSTGKLRIGKIKRDVKASKINSKFSWDAGFAWTPRDRDTVNFMTGRKIAEADSSADSSIGTDASVLWVHAWLDRLNSEVGYGKFQTKYVNATGVNYRSDDTNKIRLAVNYQMRRWLVLNAGVENSNRNSSNNAFDSKRNVYSVGASLGL